MGRPSYLTRLRRSIRNFVGILKNKVSLLKSTSSFHMAVIRATTHFPVDPPSVTTLDDVLTLGLIDSSAVVDTLLRRLRGTNNVYVALKCQLTLHYILSRGSPVLKNHIFSAPVLSGFSDESDPDTFELSRWVRWYAGVLEERIITTRVLGFNFLSPLIGQNRWMVSKLEEISVKRLLSEMGSLVGLVGEISRSPESLHFQIVSLIHEVMKLVGEDYRMTMREILALISEIERRINGLTDDELNDFLVQLRKLEDCKEKLLLMFLNKKHGCWELIEHSRKEVEGVRFQGTGLGLGTIRIGGGGKIRPSRPRGKRWLDVAWNPLVVPPSDGPTNYFKIFSRIHQPIA